MEYIFPFNKDVYSVYVEASLVIERCRMGRVKCEIKKLENSNGRQLTYAKRKQGILKKADELSILCDVPIVLIMFSPTGDPCLYSGKDSFEEVVDMLYQVPAEERTKRMIQDLETLKRTFEKVDHDIDVQESLHGRLSTSTVYMHAIQDFPDQVKQLKDTLFGIQKRLSCWADPGSVDNNLELLTKMEDTLKESVVQIQTHKEKFRNEQPVSFECSYQPGPDTHPAFHHSVEQDPQSMFWETSTDVQLMGLREEPKLAAQRDTEFSASSVIGDYIAGGGPITKEEIMSHGQATNIGKSPGIASSRQPMLGKCNCSSRKLNNSEDNTLEAFQNINQQGSSWRYNVLGRCEPPLTLETSVDSLFAELLHCQSLNGVPTPLLPSNYQREAKDRSRILFELLNFQK
ncbi:Agamous-like MADS-box protein AGL30-like protein [Drosera capensis]